MIFFHVGHLDLAPAGLVPANTNIFEIIFLLALLPLLVLLIVLDFNFLCIILLNNLVWYDFSTMDGSLFPCLRENPVALDGRTNIWPFCNLQWQTWYKVSLFQGEFPFCDASYIQLS